MWFQNQNYVAKFIRSFYFMPDPSSLFLFESCCQRFGGFAHLLDKK